MPASALVLLLAHTSSALYNDTHNDVVRRLLEEQTQIGNYGSSRGTDSSSTLSFCPFFLPCVFSCGVSFLRPPSLIDACPLLLVAGLVLQSRFHPTLMLCCCCETGSTAISFCPGPSLSTHSHSASEDCSRVPHIPRALASSSDYPHAESTSSSTRQRRLRVQEVRVSPCERNTSTLGLSPSTILCQFRKGSQAGSHRGYCLVSDANPIWTPRDTIDPPVHDYTAAPAYAMVARLGLYIWRRVHATSQLPHPHILPPVFGDRCPTPLAISALLLHSVHHGRPLNALASFRPV